MYKQAINAMRPSRATMNERMRPQREADERAAARVAALPASSDWHALYMAACEAKSANETDDERAYRVALLGKARRQK